MIQKDNQGHWNVKGLPWEDISEGKVLSQKASGILYGCLCKLKDYEESGLEPDRISEMNDFNNLLLEKLKEMSDKENMKLIDADKGYEVLDRLFAEIQKNDYKVNQQMMDMVWKSWCGLPAAGCDFEDAEAIGEKEEKNGI